MKSKGQILVETIIGVGVIGILLSAIIPLFLVGVKAGSEAPKFEQAKMLASESIEQAKAMKEENWNNLYRPLGTNNKGAANPYYIVKSGSAWALASGSENLNINNLTFTRQIIIDNVSRTGINGAGEIEASYNATRDDPSTQKITVTVTWPGSTGVEEIDYFTRHENSLWQQTDWQGEAGSQIDSSSVPGSLRLAQIPGGGTTNFGNEFVMDSLTTIFRLNNPNYKLSMRITSQKDGNVNQLRIYIAAQQKGNLVFYRYGLQNDAGGLPSGAYLSSAIANFSAVGWQTINLPAPVVVTAGSVYHLVVQYDSGSTPSSGRYIDIRATNPLNHSVPIEMAADNSANTLRFDGSWTVRDQQPVYVLRFTDNTFEGNPYDNREGRTIRGSRFEGEKFTLSTAKDVVGVGVYMAQNSIDNPNDSLYVTLRDLTTGSTLVNEAFIAPGLAGTVYSWKTHNFASTISLPAGHQYLLFFSSPGSNASRAYLILNISNPNNPEYNLINWDGINSLASRSADSGTTFIDYNFIDLSYYLLVSSSIVYAPWGELISSSLDTGNAGGGGINRISWATLGALPANTTIRTQLAANNDNVTWDFSGPNGPGTWYTVSLGTNVWTGLYSLSASQPARYLRYKIRLETTDPTVTPEVDWARVNWSI